MSLAYKLSIDGFVCHIIFKHRKRDDNGLLYVARDVYALFICRKRGLRSFFMCRENVDPRASSGKILRVKSRYPESFRFLCLWDGDVLGVSVGI